MSALILSGGGSRGAFQAGVLYKLFDQLYGSKIYGTSVGSLNSLLLAQCFKNGSPELLKQIWTNIIQKNKDVYTVSYLNIIRLKPLYGFKPLKDIIYRHIDFKGDFFRHVNIFATNLNSGNTEIFSLENPEWRIPDVALASCSFPPVFEPVKIHGDYFVDGGVRANIPTDQLRKSKESALIISCTPFGLMRNDKEYGGLINISSRSIDIMCDEINRNDVENIIYKNIYMRSINEFDLKIEIIKPDVEPTGSTLHFEHEELVKAFNTGMDAATTNRRLRI